MRSHEGKKLYFKRYKSKNNSNPNSDYDYKGVLKKFGCDWPGCGRRFRFENNLQTHIKAHQRSTDDSVEPKAPKKPAKKYKQKYKYRIPKETKVNKKYPCEWPGCTANPMPKTMLKQHMNRHKGVKPFACDHCDKCFSYRSTLRSHIQSNHQLAEETIEREFKCPFGDCTRSFSTKKGIDFHIKRAHQNDNESNFSQTRDSCDNSYNNSVMTISETPSPQYMGVQSNVIRLERIQAFNSMRINGPYERYEHHYESMGSPAGLTNRSTHTTAEKLLTNALRAQRGVRIVRPTQRQSIETSPPVNTETIIKELPIACTHDRCWRRFKSTKALEYHLKKFHP
ncbi:unnamed protein product [Medioppia subpectinata]|uniref:C2H2-type domain-containing protein n=1 Tax=Medioppia subpectinata TaxID=1979941 RepID=A0A7R9QC24_9ACAR|nr:unnamed protein product [Medioppia subpectinata]CAG2118182.1 unnamed protein product [Medioppia subpectinata]